MRLPLINQALFYMFNCKFLEDRHICCCFFNVFILMNDGLFLMSMSKISAGGSGAIDNNSMIHHRLTLPIEQGAMPCYECQYSIQPLCLELLLKI